MSDWRLEKSPALDPLADEQPQAVAFEEVDELLSEREMIGHVHTLLNGGCSPQEFQEAVESLLVEMRARKMEEAS